MNTDLRGGRAAGVRRAQRMCSAALFVAHLVLSMPAVAADVYMSRAADGTVRYASQALDSSYVLLFTDSGSSGSPATPVRATRVGPLRLQPLVDQAAVRHGVPSELVAAVIGVESAFNPHAVSAKGARGAMQLMPATGRRYGLTHPGEFDSAERNIDAGVRHLKHLLARHDGNVALALAAYNAGSGAVQRHGNRIPPYPETMLYVPAVLSRAHNSAQP